jgi:putative acetyltransferase
MISIIDYSENHHEDFRRLNLEWLKKYNLAETHDLEILDDPKGTILDRGGVIYMAIASGEVVGSAALIPEDVPGVYELAKMAVTREWQGKGISKLLIEKCLDAARARNAKRVTLFSNSQLQTAIGLYTKYGFHHISNHNSPYVTADVRMELVLSE